MPAGAGAERKMAEIEREEDKGYKAAPDELSDGDFVRWESAGGEAQGKITRIVRDGELDVPDTDFTINGYRRTYSGLRLSTCTSALEGGLGALTACKSGTSSQR